MQPLWYFNGCSWTNGTGLSDQQLFPDLYPGDYPIDQQSPKTAPWEKTRNQLLEADSELFKLWEQTNAQLSYPGQISRISPIETVNGSLSGSSMFGIKARTIKDIEDLLDQNRRPSQVFIGLTSPARIPIISNSPWGFQYSIMAINPGSPRDSNHPDRYHDYAHKLWTTHSDEEILIMYLYELLAIKNYTESRLGITPIFLKMESGWSRSVKLAQNSDWAVLEHVWALLDCDYTDQVGLCDFARSRVADGHWSASAHESFAQSLLDAHNF
jgi:hypothetical protein